MSCRATTTSCTDGCVQGCLPARSNRFPRRAPQLRVIHDVSTLLTLLRGTKSQNHSWGPDTRQAHTRRGRFLSLSRPPPRARFAALIFARLSSLLGPVASRVSRVPLFGACNGRVETPKRREQHIWIDRAHNACSTIKTGERRSVALRAYTSNARAHTHFMFIRNLQTAPCVLKCTGTHAVDTTALTCAPLPGRK